MSLQSEHDGMALYLKITRACGCCFNRNSPICSECVPANSKWRYGGWKGKPIDGGQAGYGNVNYLFEEYRNE